MKLLSTLRYSSESNPGGAGTGNYGGDLRLFFTTLNPQDVQRQNPFFWAAGSGAADTYQLPSGDAVALNLHISTNPTPGLLFVTGPIQVTTSTGITFGPPIGQAGPSFLPGQPQVSILKGRIVQAQGGVTFDVGFELSVPWDGTCADCHGSWWATWR